MVCEKPVKSKFPQMSKKPCQIKSGFFAKNVHLIEKKCLLKSLKNNSIKLGVVASIIL
jgi:hypothetical protein